MTSAPRTIPTATRARLWGADDRGHPDLLQGRLSRSRADRPFPRSGGRHRDGTGADGDVGGGVLMAARRLNPYRQGRLDGLCGVYALINALRLLCPRLTKTRASGSSAL